MTVTVQAGDGLDTVVPAMLELVDGDENVESNW